MKSISVTLPTDRAREGTLQLNEAGKTLVSYPCRGKADNKKAAENRNPSRDVTRPWGDTPSGAYNTTHVTHFDPPHETLGPIAILLDGKSGPALTAKSNGRTGLAIHGGRGNETLMATYGCVRMYDKDIADLSKLIGNDPVDVYIYDLEIE